MSNKEYIVNIGGAVFREAQYLIAKRSTQEELGGGTLGFVGGTSEPEDERSANVISTWLRREIREEIGVEVGNLYYVTSSCFQTDAGEDVLDIVFLCPYVSGEPTAMDPSEVEWVEWMTVRDVLTHPDTPPWTRKYLNACEQLRSTIEAWG